MDQGIQAEFDAAFEREVLNAPRQVSTRIPGEAAKVKRGMERLGYESVFIKEHEHSMTVYAVGLGTMERELKHGEGTQFLWNLPDLTRPEPKFNIIEQLCRVPTPFAPLP